MPHIDAKDFYIIYEEPNGVDYQKIDGYKSLTIPDNMICISSEKFDGHLNFEYRLQKNNKLIPMILEPADTANYEMGILAGEAGVLMVSTEQEKNIRYSKFYIYRKNNPRNWKNEDSYLDSVVINHVIRYRKLINIAPRLSF